MPRLPRLTLTPFILLAAAVAVAYVLFTTAHYVVHDYQIRHQEAAARSDIAQLDRDHQQLVALRDYLKSDEYVEEVARRVLGLVHPGETLVIVSGADNAAPTPVPPIAATTPGDAWWKEFIAPQADITATP